MLQRLAFITIVFAATACGKHESMPSVCGLLEGTDSSRAACFATDTVSRAYRFPVRVLSMERTDSGFRVRTVPTNASTLDGMGLVQFDLAGKIRRVTLGDSL
jgi:hypothetical protein